MDLKKIQDLKAKAKNRLEIATSPDEVRAAYAEVSELEALEREAQELIDQNASLVSSYKEVLRKEPVSKKDDDDPEDDENQNEGKALSFEDALNKVLASRKGRKGTE